MLVRHLLYLLYKKLKLDSDDLEWTVYFLAKAYYNNNVFDKAEESFQELLTLTKGNSALNNLKEDACMSLGNIAHNKNDFESAKKHYQATMDILDKADSEYPETAIYLLSRLSYMEMDKKEYKKAIEQLGLVIGIYTTFKIKDPEKLANNYLNIGYAWSQLKQPEKAIVEYLNCKNILEKEKLQGAKIYKMVLNNLAASYNNNGDDENARKYQDMAEKL